MRFVRSTLTLALACALSHAAAQALEIIPLQHRTAEQVLPVLQPLLEPGGTLTGQRNQLIVRTSARNVAEIRLALQAIDRPLRRLQISVRFDDALEAAREAVNASGQIGSRGTGVDVRALDARSSARDVIDQRVQVLEGGRAFISTGQSRPLTQRQLIQTPAGVIAQESVVIQEAATGFEVVPRIAGDTVFLDTASGAVRGRLGAWIELGGTATTRTREASGVAAMSRSSTVESRRVWLKVEAID